jgi:hypothetical protein
MSVPPTTVGPAAREGADPAGPGPTRRRLVLAAVAVVVVAALIALALVLTDDGTASPATGDGAPAAATSADPTTTPDPTVAADTGVPPAPITPEPTGPTEDVDAPPPSLPEVPLESPAAVGNGIVATLPSIEAVQGEATGPGNVNGPALRVTVRIENGTDEDVSLAGVATNLYTGTDRAPASPLDDASQRPFAGTVAAGGSAEGVYVFSVPADARDSVTVEVGYEAGAPLLLFTGPVG